MKTTVFLSGSRRITRLNGHVRERLQRVVDDGACVVVGDANGADKAIQRFLADLKYAQVTVYWAGSDCRNNVGDWEAVAVRVPSRLRGRDVFVQKDKRMAEDADHGIVVWDGKSAGAIENVLNLIRFAKPCDVFHSPSRQFMKISNVADFQRLLDNADSEAAAKIKKKIKLSTALREIQRQAQGELFESLDDEGR